MIFYIIPVQMGFILDEQGITAPATVGAIAAIGANGAARLPGLPPAARARVSVLLPIGFTLAGAGLVVIANTHALVTTVPGVLVNAALPPPGGAEPYADRIAEF